MDRGSSLAHAPFHPSPHLPPRLPRPTLDHPRPGRQLFPHLVCSSSLWLPLFREWSSNIGIHFISGGLASREANEANNTNLFTKSIHPPRPLHHHPHRHLKHIQYQSPRNENLSPLPPLTATASPHKHRSQGSNTQKVRPFIRSLSTTALTTTTTTTTKPSHPTHQPTNPSNPSARSTLAHDPRFNLVGTAAAASTFPSSLPPSPPTKNQRQAAAG